MVQEAYLLLGGQHPDFRQAAVCRVLANECRVLVCCPQMWGAYRCAAGFLLLVMLVPAFGPVVMPCAAQPQGTHCVRKAISSHAAMSCHHAMGQTHPTRAESSQGQPEGELLQASFEAANLGKCCQSHCCCGATTSEWAQPAS